MDALAEMHRQVGDLVLDENGVAMRGLLIRHLLMPGGLAGTEEWMAFLAGLSPKTYVNIMDQYRPCGRACNYPELSRSITPQEYEDAKHTAFEAGITRLDNRESRVVWRLLRHFTD
jgi:putative pyruvate formate lyase activating enzyme